VTRGFQTSEYHARLARAQDMMGPAGLAALLLTTEPEIRYFTGFLTRFWESPTRPWFLVLPAAGAPIAVIPAIGRHLMAQSWISDIRTWQAPDYADDGIGLLADALIEVAGPDGLIGLPDQMESHVRMPLADFYRLQALLGGGRLTGDATIMRRLRLVKSEAEIGKIGTACAIADRAFARVPEIAAPGVPLSQVFRRFQMLCLEEGADYVPYLAGAAGQGGYGDVISPSGDTPLAAGDVLMLDTGLVHDGYFCDFDRNFSLGPASAELQSAHSKLMEATRAAFDIARPGITAADLFHAMNGIVNPGGAASEAGRLGHGLGMQLTEWPSLVPDDLTVLTAGMVLTLEPGIALSQGRILVHEENIVIREGGAEFLSDHQPGPIREVALQ
jgi:Xaa-Pro aminopeptidase